MYLCTFMYIVYTFGCICDSPRTSKNLPSLLDPASTLKKKSNILTTCLLSHLSLHSPPLLGFHVHQTTKISRCRWLLYRWEFNVLAAIIAPMPGSPRDPQCEATCENSGKTGDWKLLLSEDFSVSLFEPKEKR